MAEDEIFSFNFELFDRPIFSLEIIDDIGIFTGRREQPELEPVEDLDDFEDEVDTIWDFLVDDGGMTWQELIKFSDSNRPEIAQAARDMIGELEPLVKNLDIATIDSLQFTPLRITENIAGRQIERPLPTAASTASSGGGGGGGGGGGMAQAYDELTEMGYDVENDIDYYTENFTSDQWQSIRQGFSTIEDEAIQMWEDETGLDYDDFQRGLYEEEDDYDEDEFDEDEF